MTCSNTTVTLDGFSFTFISRLVVNSQTVFCYDVSGNGTGDADLSNWVLEVCPNNPDEFKNFINIVSCTKQVLPGGIIQNATCSKVTKPNPSGNQVNLIGVKFDEAVGKEASDPTIQFCVTFDTVLDEDCVNVGYKAGQDVFQTTVDERINGPICTTTPPPPPPGEREVVFCCYVTVPEDFMPVEVSEKPVIKAAIVNNCTFLCNGTKAATCTVDSLVCDLELPTTSLVGCLQIQNALKIKEIEGDQKTFVCCCDCICIEEELCVACPGCPTTPTNLEFMIDIDSLDAEFIDSCVGKSVYKITGKVIITFECPTCNVQISDSQDRPCSWQCLRKDNNKKTLNRVFSNFL